MKTAQHGGKELPFSFVTERCSEAAVSDEVCFSYNLHTRVCTHTHKYVTTEMTFGLACQSDVFFIILKIVYIYI